MRLDVNSRQLSWRSERSTEREIERLRDERSFSERRGRAQGASRTSGFSASTAGWPARR